MNLCKMNKLSLLQIVVIFEILLSEIISSAPIPQDDPYLPLLDSLISGMDDNSDQPMMPIPSISDLPSFPTLDQPSAPSASPPNNFENAISFPVQLSTSFPMPDQPPAPPASPPNNFQNTLSFPVGRPQPQQSSGYSPFGQMTQQFLPHGLPYPQNFGPQNMFMSNMPNMPFPGAYQLPGQMSLPQFSQLSNLLPGNIDPSNLQGINTLPPNLLQQLLSLPVHLLQLILQIPNIVQQQNLLQHLIQNPQHIQNFLPNSNQQPNNPMQRFQRTRQQNILTNPMLPMLG